MFERSYDVVFSRPMKDDGDGLAPSPEWLAARTRELEERLSALGESEQILRSVLDAVPDFIARITVDGRIVFANRPMPSFSPERGCAETVFDLVDPAYHTTVRECFEHVLHTSAQGRCEARGQGTFGSQSQYLVRVAPICDVAGVVGMTLIATDITGIRHAREVWIPGEVLHQLLHADVIPTPQRDLVEVLPEDRRS